MADNVKFEDYSAKVIATMNSRIVAALEECGGEVVSQTVRNSRKDTGQTLGSFQHKVVDDDLTVYMGSNAENAIWEEFGTGEHSLNGKGRKGAWYVPVDGYTGKKAPTFQGSVVIVYGKEGKKFFKTDGKKPSRAFWKAYTESKTLLKRILENALKGL